jgi:endonuclease YncB( thermonuclease family)
MSLSLSLVAWLLLTVHALAQDVIHGRVTAVNDGDTIKVLTAEKQLLRVRVAWIDAPESSQAFGQRAKQAMSALVFGKDVELRFHTVDRYGRLICMVLVDGTDAGLELIREGFAWAYAKYLPEASLDIQRSYTAAEAAARARSIGLWADPDPVPPWQYRKTEHEQPAALSERE